MVLKQRKLNKILIITLSLFAMISFISCSDKVDGASKKVGNLIIKTQDYSFEFDKYQEIPYMNYDEVFDIEGKQKPTGRYSDITPDKKINWNVKEVVEYEQTPIVKDMMNKITLDGKSIKLPMEFKDLGKEYAEFEKADYSKFTKDTTPFTIRNTKNKYYLVCHSYLDKLKTVSVSIRNKDKFLIRVEVNKKDKKITGLYNDSSDYLSIKELKVDGIGVGNTFNEMYEKFGKPNEISPEDEYFGRDATYYLEDKKNNISYIIRFVNANKLYHKDTKQIENIKPNVITGVKLTIIRKPSDED